MTATYLGFASINSPVRGILLTMLAFFLGAEGALSAAPAPEPIDVPIADLQDRYRLVGTLGRPLGKLVKVEGVVVTMQNKAAMGKFFILPTRIDGRAVQGVAPLEIQNSTGVGGYSDAEAGETEPESDGKEMREIAIGQSVVLRGFETGAFVGIPAETYRQFQLAIPTRGFGFTTWFDAYQCRPLNAPLFDPADFVGRRALFHGRAVSRRGVALLEDKDWHLVVDANKPWPAWAEGKPAEAIGTIRGTPTPRTYVVEACETHLRNLSDQVGHDVALRGRIWSMNGEYEFRFRDRPVRVDRINEIAGRLKGELHGEFAIVRGTLGVIEATQADQGEPSAGDKKRPTYIVRNATIERIQPVLVPDRLAELSIDKD